MKEIFINLKRFDVPKSSGGLCPVEDPQEWISTVMEETIDSGIFQYPQIPVTFFLPEGLIPQAVQTMTHHGNIGQKRLSIGCQGVYRKDIEPAVNFGAFTSHRPASAAKALGATWAIIGHSEERLGFEELFSLARTKDDISRNTINTVLGEEAMAAVKAGLNVLYCIGETEEERGVGNPDEIKNRVGRILESQLRIGLLNFFAADKSFVPPIIAYEPRWAIGPGKLPPDAEYIEFVADLIKLSCIKLFGHELKIVYGGGLKESNASSISSVSSLDGGLIALTQFEGDIGFSVKGLKRIIDRYMENENEVH